MRWDRDLVRGGKLDARRLLLNAATPFTLTTANPIADDALLDDPDATCCGKRRPMPWVRLDFESDEVGVRLPRVTPFPGGAAHVRWHGLWPPVVVADGVLAAGANPADRPRGDDAGDDAVRQAGGARAGEAALVGAGPAIVRLELHRGLKIVAVAERRARTAQQRRRRAARRRGRRRARHPADRAGGPVPLPVLLRRHARVRRQRMR